MMKKSVSVLLAVMIVFGIFASLPFAAGAAITDKGKTGGGGPSIYVRENDSNTAVYDWDGVHNDAFPGISYDKESNTLTIEEGAMPVNAGLRIYSLGKDFKLNVVGKVATGTIEMYDTCLNIVGSGMLEVNSAEDYGVSMRAWAYNFFDLTIDVADTVSAVFNGKKAAVHMSDSSHENADNVVTVNKEKSVGSFSREHTGQATEEIRCAEVTDQAYYLCKSKEDGSYFGLEKDCYDNFNGEIRFIKLSYDEETQEYSIDDSYSSSMSGQSERDDMLSYSDYTLEKNGEEEPVEIMCKNIQIQYLEVYEDSQGKRYGANVDSESSEVFDYDESVTVEYEDQKYIACTRNNEVDIKTLTPVETSCYEYTCSDARLEIYSDKRGASAAIYLDSDEQFSVYDINGVHNDAVENVSYNAESNTLTLDNAALGDFTLTSYYLGKDFNLEVKGACALKAVVVYDGGLTVTGSGTLTVSGADYGISVEPLAKDYYDSTLDFSENTGLDVNGSVSAFRVSGTTFDEASAVTQGKAKAVEGVYKKGSVTTEATRSVKGATLSEWSGGVGYRYKVVKDGDPDHVYCARIYSETKMDAYGRPSSTVKHYDMKQCVYDELSGRNIIIASMGDLDSSEFEEGGYSLIENSASIAGYVLMSCYYVESVSAEAYTDGTTLYAVSGENVYSYSEEKKVTSNGKPVYLFEEDSVDLTGLTEVKDEFTYSNFEYNGAKFTQEAKAEATEATESTEATTAQPGGNPTQPAPTGSEPYESKPTQPGEQPTQPGEQPTQATNPPMNVREFRYLPSAEQIANGNNYKLVIQDSNGEYHSYDFEATPMIIDGKAVYSAVIPINIKPVSIQYQVYKDGVWQSQLDINVELYAAKGGGIIMSNGKAYGEEEATVAPTEAPKDQKTDSTTKKTTKKANTVKVTAKKKTITAKKLSSKKQKIKLFTIKNAKGAVTVKLVKSGTAAKLRKKISVSKKGVVTFKKGSYPTGKFKIKVKVKAKGNKGFKAKSVTKIGIIRIK